MELSVSHRYLPPRSRLSRRPSRRDQSGAALLEFVLVAIPFFMILYALIAFGMALAVKQSVTNATAEGARSAVGQTNYTTAKTTATNTVANRLSWLHGNYQASTDLSVQYVNPATSQCDSTYTPSAGATGVSICVTVSIPYRTRHIVPAPIVQNVLPSQVKSVAIVQIT
jgi:Flp pilus assembly protein TadG